MTVLLLSLLMVYVTMVYGPIAAFLVELFPTRIRYSSMSLPYHIGNGWFGGFLPFIAAALVVKSGNIYYGLWYPIVVAAMTAVVGGLFIKDRRDVDLRARLSDQASSVRQSGRCSVPSPRVTKIASLGSSTRAVCQSPRGTTIAARPRSETV